MGLLFLCLGAWAMIQALRPYADHVAIEFQGSECCNGQVPSP